VSAGKAEANKNSKTEIEVQYFGANDQNWITGLTMEELKQAVIDFPQNCVGNINDYILWPYDNILAYQQVVTDVKVAQAKPEQNNVPEDPFIPATSKSTPEKILSSVFTEAVIEI